MKRFYQNIAVEKVAGGYQLLLDQRPVKTQAGKPQIIPTADLAHLLAREWEAQPEEIDPTQFPVRDLADHAIDNIRTSRSDTIKSLLAFAETDTLCYRAEPGEALYRKQEEQWEPLVTAVEESEGIQFQRVSGIIHHAQPSDTLARLEKKLETLDDFQLAGVQAMASLAASLIIALTALDSEIDGEALWTAANLEEEWQAETWGRDTEAQARREERGIAFHNALQFTRLACSETEPETGNPVKQSTQPLL